MKEQRSASQILFGFLPNQTVDLQGRVWKVSHWINPEVERVIDMSTLRRELVRATYPWHAAGKDRSYRDDLERGAPIKVLSLSLENGIQVVPFPKLWVCKKCDRLTKDLGAACACGSQTSPGPFHFVGYCKDCGALREPYIRKCKTHNQVRVIWPGTASATEIVFACPVCNTQVQRGLGMPPCDCGGTVVFSVHRAASVYTPRNVVIVNPPSQPKIKAITEAGGPPRALAWIVNGMRTRDIEDAPTTAEALRQQLASQGLKPEQIELMLGALGKTTQDPTYVTEFNLSNKEDAESQAVSVALATSGSRLTIQDLLDDSSGTPMEPLYRERYPEAITRAGLNSVDLIDKFPVLTGMFGFTRGPAEPGESCLVPFVYKGDYAVYGDIAETEALFVRLDPLVVCNWLRAKGHRVEQSENATTSRVAIVRATCGDDARSQAAHEDLFKLVHSYSHRLIRLAAVYGGIDRNALSELVVPLHAAFFVYAAARGDFVLGGLQALFETELDQMLSTFIDDDHICPLDPGCKQGGGACMACLHLGEPSCRHFNAKLSRDTLIGESGYLPLVRQASGRGH